MEIDVGFYIKVTCRIRIKNYDAPELFRPSCEAEKTHAIEAFNKAKEILVEGSIVTIITYKEGVYNRWTADIVANNDRSYADYMKELGFSKLDKY
jgi:hypothetical protein